MKNLTKQTLALAALALLTAASASARDNPMQQHIAQPLPYVGVSLVNESTVNPQVTDSVTQVVTLLTGQAQGKDMVTLAQSDTPDNLMKIGQSDVPDNMLSLLTALRAQNQKLGVRTAEQGSDAAALNAEAKALIDYVKAGNAIEEGDTEALRDVLLSSI
jgi:hypothetical protein